MTWDVLRDEDERMLAFRWAERDAPARRGFGLTMVERGLARDLGGEARAGFRPEGVRATLRAPLLSER